MPGGGDAGREKRFRLERQLKGQLNRLAESNMHVISRQIEEYYGQNSRNDMNEVLCGLMTQGMFLLQLSVSYDSFCHSDLSLRLVPNYCHYQVLK